MIETIVYFGAIIGAFLGFSASVYVLIHLASGKAGGGMTSNVSTVFKAAILYCAAVNGWAALKTSPDQDAQILFIVGGQAWAFLFLMLSVIYFHRVTGKWK